MSGNSVQMTATVESNKLFCEHSIVPYRQTTRRRQPSLYGQRVNGGSVKKC